MFKDDDPDAATTYRIARYVEEGTSVSFAWPSHMPLPMLGAQVFSRNMEFRVQDVVFELDIDAIEILLVIEDEEAPAWGTR